MIESLATLAKAAWPALTTLVIIAMAWARLDARVAVIEDHTHQTQQILKLKAPLDVANDISELRDDLEDVKDDTQSMRIQLNTLCVHQLGPQNCN